MPCRKGKTDSTRSELGKRLDFYEVKRDVRDIKLSLLDGKTNAYFEKNGMPKKGWTVRCLGLSLNDM